MLNFDQDARLDAYDWEQVLFQFIHHYGINFIKLELLMLFYRSLTEAVGAKTIVDRTGYHPREITVNLSKLVADGLLRGEGVAEDGLQPAAFRRLGESEFAGHGLLWQVIQRLVRDFKEREGRLKIIYALLKAREEEE